MSILSRLFGGGSGGAEPQAEAETYQGFTIFPEPQKEGNQFRIAARIEKEIGGEVKVHRLIRADMIGDRDEAVKASTGKAQQMIDEQGDGIFS